MMKYRLYLACAVLIIGLIAVGASVSRTTQASPAAPDGGDVLVNGDFEIEDPKTHGFVWYKPNHFLALYWHRWWVDDGATVIPEYDDMRPSSGRWPPVSGEHGQVYFKWGYYQAGIYQVVENLTPCVPYEFKMYARSAGNTGTVPHAKIGLDPQGTALTKGDIGMLDDADANLVGWPPYMKWSPEQTALFTWNQLAVKAEPLGTRLTTVAYAFPTYSGPNQPWFDTWWDAGYMTQVDFPNGRLPEPTSWASSLLQNVQNVQQGDQLVVTWSSTVAASTQVWYYVYPYVEPITVTVPLTYTSYFPVVIQTRTPQATLLNSLPVMLHTASIPITGLEPGDKIEYWVLSRRPATDACVTEGLGAFEYTIPGLP